MPTDNPSLGSPRQWWQTGFVTDVLADLLAAELARLRPGDSAGAGAALQPIAPDTPLADSGAEAAAGPRLSSLELIEVATGLAVQFGLKGIDQERRLLRRPTLRAWTAALRDARREDDRSLWFRTSGSTGTPKLCRHTMGALHRETAFWAGLLADRRRVLRAVPSHHIYGFLFTVLLPTALGLPVREVRDGLPAGALRRAEPGDLLVAHPAFLDAALRAEPRPVPDLTLVTSTAPCPGPLLATAAAIARGGVLEVYGATETGGIGLRRAPGEPFELLPFWCRAAHGATALRRAAPSAADPNAPEALLVEPLDRLAWQDERRFQVLGRRDGAVQVGGINVFPAQVRALLEQHPAVAAAAVALAPGHAASGLAARVVPSTPRAEPDTLRALLDGWLRARLPAQAVPRSLSVVDRLDAGDGAPTA